jgi:hypothetical protein
MPDYVRQATFAEERFKPEEIRSRIKSLKTEIEELNEQLENLEDG